MPIYMDRHYMANATRRAIALAHQKDLAIQDEYGVRFLTYWFDEDRNTTFCRVDAPDKESVNCVHSHAHGDIPHEIVEVDPALVDAFLGGIGERIPVHNDNIEDPDNAGPGLRYIMFTDLVDSTATTTRLGDQQAMHLLRIHNALTRNALRDHDGREVKHTGDGFMCLLLFWIAHLAAPLTFSVRSQRIAMSTRTRPCTCASVLAPGNP